jgi:MFS family permease
VVNAVGQPAFGSLVDRFGPRRVILPSLALMALGTGLVSVAGSPWHMVVLYGVVAGVGYTGCGILPVSVHVSRWHPGERGFATAVAACGFSLGQLVFTQVAAHAVALAGWRRTYALLGSVLATSWMVIAAWLRDAPPTPGPTAPPPGSATPSADRAAALRTPAFWCLTGGLVGCGFTDFLLATHLAPFATDLGLSPQVAANALSLWAAANAAGILVAGGVATRIGARRTLVATYCVRATALFLLLAVRETWQLYLFAILFGATFFTTAPLSATLVGELFGPARQGAIFGSANLFHHLAAGLGAYAGGLVFDVTGSYRPIFLVSGFIVIGSAVVSAFARRRRP